MMDMCIYLPDVVEILGCQSNLTKPGGVDRGKQMIGKQHDDRYP